MVAFVAVMAACGGDGTSDGAEPAPPADAGPSADSRPRATVEQGVVVGEALGGGVRFLGIPYAAAPVGELRFASPRPAPGYAELEATRRVACPQAEVEAGIAVDEDCLVLNVWAPDDAESLPVMVWIHGGGWDSGAGALAMYDGANLAARGVVVVTINYRLGALGYLAHRALVGTDPAFATAGNYGMLDQVAALAWLKRNVAAFGGDPDNVTVFGESAGAFSTCNLVATGAGQGLFHRAIMESGACPDQAPSLTAAGNPLQPGPALAAGDAVADRLGCDPAGDVPACLRRANVADLLAASAGISYWPIIDGDLIERASGASFADGSAMSIPILLGSNVDEGTIFVRQYKDATPDDYTSIIAESFGALGDAIIAQYPLRDYDTPYQALSAIVGDLLFVCDTTRTARRHTLAGHPAWLYRFGYVPPFAAGIGLGAFHGAELAFVFGNQFRQGTFSATERELIDRIQSLWVSFAATGRPTAAGIDWPAYDPATDLSLSLGSQIGVVTAVRADNCAFWYRTLGEP
jgi:para-nitrobenzyl esterase